MIPIRDDNARHRKPVVTLVLLAVNVVVFFHELFLPGPDLTRFADRYGLIPATFFESFASASAFLSPASLGIHLLPLITYQFLHAGWLHLLGNMWVLWVFGDNVEDRMGALRFAGFYLTGGIMAGLVHCLMHLGSSVPTIGASGAIAAVLGAYLLLFPGVWVTVLAPILPFLWLPVKIPAFLVLGVWLAAQVLGGMNARGVAEGIAFWAHVGGFGAGMLLVRTRFFRPRGGGGKVRRKNRKARR